MYTIGIIAIAYFLFEVFKIGELSAQKKIIAAFVFIFFYFLFNAIYEQSGGSLSLFAKYNLNDKLLGLTIDPNAVNNSSNTLFVIILSPLIGLLWVWLANKKIEPNTLIKFGIGFYSCRRHFIFFIILNFLQIL
jgi:POT family proton-dependent oligopeptide transporter